MGNATGIVSWRKGQGFKEWEKAKLDSQEVKRKADVAQLCQSACVSLGEMFTSPKRSGTSFN